MGLWTVIASCMSLLWLGSRGRIPRCVLIFQLRGQDTLLVHAWELLWLCLSGNSQSSLIGSNQRGDSEAKFRTASIQSIGVWKFGKAIFNQTPTWGRIEGQFLGRDPFIGYCKEEGSRRTINSKFRAQIPFRNWTALTLVLRLKRNSQIVEKGNPIRDKLPMSIMA